MHVLELAATVLARWSITLLSPRPTISRNGDVLHIRSSWRTAVFTLGARSRRVRVDLPLERIRIDDRRWWFIKRVDRIAFAQIAAIVYSHGDLNESTWLPHQGEDLFTVGLKLVDERRVPLFRFYGVGHHESGFLPDWMSWEEHVTDMFNVETHESDSRMLADLLVKLLGAPLES